MGNSCNKLPPFIVNTLGDSITESGKYGQLTDCSNLNENCYQYYLYQYLLSRSIENRIKNLGIGGQTASQICDRIFTAVPGTYITIMAGTNDVLGANYADPEHKEKIAEHIVGLYREKIPSVIAYQSQTLPPPVVVVCTIPPTGPTVSIVPATSAQLTETIDYVNNELKKFVEEMNSPNIILCDTNRNLKGFNDRYIYGIYLEDGIHLNERGYKICGEAIAQRIVESYYGWNL